jgi:hypothetical protein
MVSLSHMDIDPLSGLLTLKSRFRLIPREVDDESQQPDWYVRFKCAVAEQSKTGAPSKDMLTSLMDMAVQEWADGLSKMRSDILLERNNVVQQFQADGMAIWHAALSRFELFVFLIEQLVTTLYEDLLSPGNQTPLQEAQTRLLARSCLTTNEILALSKSGLAAGAIARSRTLHELEVTSRFLAKYGDNAAERFLLHSHIDNYRVDAQLVEQGIASELNSEKSKKLKSKRDELIDRFGKGYGKDNGWACVEFGTCHDSRPRSIQIADIEKCVGLSHWRPLYRIASRSVHSTALDGLNAIRSISDLSIPVFGPFNGGIAEPVAAGARSLEVIAGLAVNTRSNVEDYVATRLLSTLRQNLEDELQVAHDRWIKTYDGLVNSIDSES